jgi:hypothetical protein
MGGNKLTLLTEGSEYVKAGVRTLIVSFLLWSVATADAKYCCLKEYEQEHCENNYRPQLAGEWRYHFDGCVVCCVNFSYVYTHSENIPRYYSDNNKYN